MAELYYDIKKYDFNSQYGFTNIDEFIAEAFTNKGFQEILANIEYDRKTGQSILNKILEIIGNLLGIKSVKNSALEVAFSILDDYTKIFLLNLSLKLHIPH